MTLTTSPAETFATSHALVSWSTIMTATATPTKTSQCARDPAVAAAASAVPPAPPVSPIGMSLIGRPRGGGARS